MGFSSKEFCKSPNLRHTWDGNRIAKDLFNDGDDLIYFIIGESQKSKGPLGFPKDNSLEVKI